MKIMKLAQVVGCCVLIVSAISQVRGDVPEVEADLPSELPIRGDVPGVEGDLPIRGDLPGVEGDLWEDETERELSYTSTTDTEALCDFYSSVTSTGPLSSWQCSSGGNNNDACSGGSSSWEGVTCNINNRVKGLNLAGLQLNGATLPTTLGSMRKMTELTLGDATGAGLSGLSIGGTIPKELGNLKRLRILNLGSNVLTGKVRRRLADCTKLEVLWLLNNELHGRVPSELGMLSAITDLDLSDNALTGRIPKALGDATTLQVLNLGTNSLTGNFFF